MDIDDHRRYFIVGSVIMEIVTPVFRQRLEKDYKSKGFGCLQDFINSKPVIHILFHLRHTNIKCCVDSTNCRNRGTLPLNYSQWDLLYTENPGPPNKPGHHCHCLYTVNNSKLDDLDITLASLILLNCCNLTTNEATSIKKLRKFKNNYLSHNTKGAITEKEFQTLWIDLETCVLKLDKSKQDDIIRIQNRPLDDSLCNKYCVCLLDIHQQLDEIDTRIQNIGSTTVDIHSTSTEILSAMNINNAELKTKLEEVLQQLKKTTTNNQVDQLGQSIFTLHDKINLKSVVEDGRREHVTDIVIMDDGRVVVCLFYRNRLLIYNTDGSQVDSMCVKNPPWNGTEVNNYTIAVTLLYSNCVEMYDINNKLKLISISLPGMWSFGDITTINNKLVVSGNNRLLIIDHQTGEVVQTIKTNCYPNKLHGSSDRIFYCKSYRTPLLDVLFNNNNNLYWYSYTDGRHHTLTLPSLPKSMTTLQDGSLYVVCKDGSVQHVSSDGKQYKTVTTDGLNNTTQMLHYNKEQRKLRVVKYLKWENIFYMLAFHGSLSPSSKISYMTFFG